MSSKKIKTYGNAVYRWTNQVMDPVKLFNALPEFLNYLEDWNRYSKMDDAEVFSLHDSYPCLYDRTSTTGFPKHYFYQDIWAFKKVYDSKVEAHVDVGSRIDLIGFLTGVTKVTFIDIRPLMADLDNFESRKGSIISMPYDEGTVNSLSCLHVAEHIGLGRYGDPLDPKGTEKSCSELTRILKPGGNLYFSLPLGRPRVCFNAHRVHSPGQILSYFKGLELVELSGITDDDRFFKNIDISVLENSEYACGLFHFTKP